MKVQRVRPPNTDQIRWIVLDDEFVPIQPICSYLTVTHGIKWPRRPSIAISLDSSNRLTPDTLRHLVRQTALESARRSAE
jgi:hypothetical protein